MNDFLVLVVSKDLLSFMDIANYFEEEEAISLIDTVNTDHAPSSMIALNALAADMVVLLDTWAEASVFERICRKVNTPYFVCSDADNAKEVIAETFVEWSESNGT